MMEMAYMHGLSQQESNTTLPRTQDIDYLRGELSTIKTSLLSRKHFPQTPTTPGIPSWQRPDSSMANSTTPGPQTAPPTTTSTTPQSIPAWQRTEAAPSTVSQATSTAAPVPLTVNNNTAPIAPVPANWAAVSSSTTATQPPSEVVLNESEGETYMDASAQ